MQYQQMLWHLAPPDQEGTAPPRVTNSQRQLTTHQEGFLSCTNYQSKAHTSHTSFTRLFHIKSIPLPPSPPPPTTDTSGPGTRQLRTASMLQSLLKLFQLANPNSAYPVLPCFSHGNDNKGCSPGLSSFPLSPNQLSFSLCGPPAEQAMPPVSRDQ